MANSVDPDQTAPIGAVCYWSTLFASLLYSSVMLGNYLQQATSADNIFRCIFSWRFRGLIWQAEQGVTLTRCPTECIFMLKFTFKIFIKFDCIFPFIAMDKHAG